MNRVVFDSGPLVALLDRNDDQHGVCRDWFTSYQGQRLLPAPVMTEVCWQFEKVPHIEADFLRSVTRGEFTVVDLDRDHIRRAVELVTRYADFPLGFVDAAVIAVAERLTVPTIATLDARHFRAVRPLHIDTFTLVP